MEMTDVVPLTKPDPLQMRRHVAHLFEGWLDGCHDGRIELAWTDARDGRLTRAAIFGTDELDELVDRAVIENGMPGQNVYIGQALRKPDTPPFGRCSDDDFLCLTALYVDIDDDVTQATVNSYRARACPPTAVVVTGRHPHIRTQMLWRLDSPMRDGNLCRQQNAALAQALGGDPSVVNPSRVMRLGGSIAWPVKAGRIIELTEFQDFDDVRHKAYAPEQVARAFPAAQPPLVPLAVVVEATTVPARGPALEIGKSNLSVDACIAAIRGGSHWHDNMLRLVGHWISRQWSDGEILAAAEAMTLPGYTAEQTRRDASQMILGGRRKWAQPNPSYNIEGNSQHGALDLMAWTAERYVGDAKPIQWLCTGTIPLAVPVLVAAMGGLGKSYLALDLALNIAAGVAGLEQPRLILGGRIAAEGTAVVITAEDSFDAVHRRLNRIDPTSRRLHNPKRLIVLPMSDAGGAQPLIAADGKSLACTPFYNDLRQQLLEIDDLRLVVFDPLQAFVSADVNADPAAAQFLWSTMAELAATAGATVMIPHHMRKDGMMRIADGDAAREAIRGTTALVDGARLAYVLWKLDDEAAKPVCEQLKMPFERGRIVRGAVVKANDEANFATHTYVRQESGLLIQLDSEPSIVIASDSEAPFPLAKAREILIEVSRRFEAGVPFSASPQGQARYLGYYLTSKVGMSRTAALKLITNWLNNGVVTIEVCDRKTKLKGLKVLRWL